jgi:hypothetical protein
VRSAFTPDAVMRVRSAASARRHQVHPALLEGVARNEGPPAQHHPTSTAVDGDDADVVSYAVAPTSSRPSGDADLAMGVQ